MANMFTVASKEFSDIVRGRRFIVLVVIFGLVMAAAIGTTYLTLVQGAGQRGGVGLPRGFLGAAAFSLVTVMSYFAPIMGIALGCDAISGEKEKGTLKITLAQPVFRDTVINGKFLAALGAISLATVIASLVEVGGSMLVLGVTPTADDVVRLAFFLLFSILFAMTYYGIAVLLSTVSKRTTQSVIIGVSLWAVFAFVIPIIASLVAFSTVPISFQPGRNMTITSPEVQQYIEQLRGRAAVMQTIQSVTPNFHFSQIAQYILSGYAGVRMGFGGGRLNLGGADLRTTSIAESLGYAWPNILVLTLATTLVFIASYLLFTRQEVR